MLGNRCWHWRLAPGARTPSGLYWMLSWQSCRSMRYDTTRMGFEVPYSILYPLDCFSSYSCMLPTSHKQVFPSGRREIIHVPPTHPFSNRPAYSVGSSCVEVQDGQKIDTPCLRDELSKVLWVARLGVMHQCGYTSLLITIV